MQNSDKILLRIARESIRYELETKKRYHPSGDFDPALIEPGATFVTLKIRESLRGCMGSIEATMPLIEDVAKNASNAAFRDPRFPPLEINELSSVHISISILSRFERIDARNKDELIASIRPGIDGILLEDGPRRATFLPSVWESLTEPEEFIAHLMAKGGFPRESELENAIFYRYTAQYIEE